MIAVIGRLLAAPETESGLGGLAARIAVLAAAGGSTVELISKLGDDGTGDAALFALTRAGVGHAAILRDPARSTPVMDGPPAAAAPDGPSADGVSVPSEADDDWLGPIGEDAVDGLAGEGLAEVLVGRPKARQPISGGLDLAPADLELALRYLPDLSVVVLADPAAPELLPPAADGAAFAGAALVVVAGRGWPADGAAPDATLLAAPELAADDGTFATLVAEYAVALDGGRSPGEAWALALKRVGAERA